MNNNHVILIIIKIIIIAQLNGHIFINIIIIANKIKLKCANRRNIIWEVSLVIVG